MVPMEETPEALLCFIFEASPYLFLQPWGLHNTSLVCLAGQAGPFIVMGKLMKLFHTEVLRA